MCDQSNCADYGIIFLQAVEHFCGHLATVFCHNGNKSFWPEKAFCFCSNTLKREAGSSFPFLRLEIIKKLRCFAFAVSRFCSVIIFFACKILSCCDEAVVLINMAMAKKKLVRFTIVGFVSSQTYHSHMAIHNGFMPLCFWSFR